MAVKSPEIVVAGHICLDLIPTLQGSHTSLEKIFIPGRLIQVGRAITATGGVVSNTGLALHRLGLRTGLMGKVGDDLIGRAILDILRSHDEQLAHGMVVSEGEDSSYTVVISPPGFDRIFLHCQGANNTFVADDLDYGKLDGVRLFHFGYPPLMQRFHEGSGEELSKLFRQVKELGLTTSLDMAMPDPRSEAGRANWQAILQSTLPNVDIFLPSIEEILYMIRRDMFDELNARAGEREWAGAGESESACAGKSGGAGVGAGAGESESARAGKSEGAGAGESGGAGVGAGAGESGGTGAGKSARGILPLITPDILADVSAALLQWGARIVCLKLGDQGIYLRTADAARFAADAGAGAAAPADPVAWGCRELWVPCFQARNVVGTTGSGDCSIAGFLAGMLKGLAPAEALTGAVAVGACNVEAADAVSGIVPWEQVQQRIADGWERLPILCPLAGWHFDPTHHLWVGPHDSGGVG